MKTILLMSSPSCLPFSPCWCEQHPNHPKCNQVGVPINNGIGFLLVAGLVLGIYKLRKLK